MQPASETTRSVSTLALGEPYGKQVDVVHARLVAEDVRDSDGMVDVRRAIGIFALLESVLVRGELQCLHELLHV